jgi:AcrR family transcriptional regulator
VTASEQTDKVKNRNRQGIERRNRDLDVMAAAISVMSERGYAATSIQEIADRVGVLKGSLYHYFSSKEELLFRILSESHSESETIMQDVAALSLEPLDELSEFLRRECIWFLSNVSRANIYFTASSDLTGPRLKEIQGSDRGFTEHLLKLITAAQVDGQIASDIDASLLTRFVLGSLNNVRAWPNRSSKSFSKEEMADAFVILTRNALQATS